MTDDLINAVVKAARNLGMLEGIQFSRGGAAREIHVANEKLDEAILSLKEWGV